MGDPALLAGVLALVKPLPPKAVAGRPGFTTGQASPATIATGGPMGCDSRPRGRAKPLAGRYIIHSKFRRAAFTEFSLGRMVVSDRFE